MDLDKIITTIEGGDPLSERDVTMLLRKFMELLFREDNILSLSAPIIVCGDIHGQLYDLFELFRVGGPPADNKYLFMGDYVDRGYYSLETFCYLIALKMKYPDNVYLLRGNHECRTVNQMYGFFEDCLQSYGHPGIWKLCNEVFDLLPIAALINRTIFSVHGGLSPDIALIEQISLLDRNDELPSSGPLADLTWSDPDLIESWEVNQRGAGFIFGSKPVEEFCHNNKLKMITRAHQMAMDGYQYFFDNKLITVWSAPNYMYRSGNAASVLCLDENLDTELRVFQAVPNDKRKIPSEYVPRYFA